MSDTKPMCDCLGCDFGTECCADPAPVQAVQQPDFYVEARLSLVEEMFAQLLGGVPEQIAVQISTEYNRRRRVIIGHHFPHLKQPEPEAPVPEKGRIITFPH